MNEFAYISKYIQPLLCKEFGTESEDAAMVSSSNSSFLVTHDMLIEGVHFLSGTDPELLAKKALRVNLSDLAAMGAVPHAYLLGLSLPSNVTEQWWERFSSGLRSDNQKYKVRLLGGDTTGNPVKSTIICITALGIPSSKILTRSKAKDGDIIFISGTIGDAALGLMAYNGLIEGRVSYLKQRYNLPNPRVTLGSCLSDVASSCIDISDGLIQDIGHICNLSNVGADIHLNNLPMSDEAHELLKDNVKIIERMVTGGDDYELAFTASPSKRKEINDISQRLGVRVTEIGRITLQKGVRVYDMNGEIMHLGSTGYMHFV